MSGPDGLRRSLDTHLQGRVSDMRAVRENEMHCVTKATEIPMVATIFREHGGELALMVGTDRRLDRGMFEVHYLFVHRAQNLFVQVTVAVSQDNPVIASLATSDYPASRFEREIEDLLGIRFHGHPDPRPLVRHAFWPDDFFPLRKDAGTRDFQDDGRPFPFQQVGGEGVYEIPVGPIHAGVIEPGHFRFSVVGETVIDMTSRLYFTHKGTEKLFEGRAPGDGVELAERISGDTSVGHALAYCEALERLSGLEVPARARYQRVLVLELERLYNHVADFGMIANDCGFAAAHSHCFRIRERLFRLNKSLTGHRLLRGCLVPGGLAADLPADPAVISEVEEAHADFEEIVEITLANTLVADRLERTGRLTTRTARGHGVLGFVARASGIDVDARRDHPFAAYGELEFRVPVFESGDVEARTLARVEEARESVGLIRQVIERLPSGPVSVPLGPLPAYESAFGVVEGWRGTILHWVMADAAGTLERVKVLDPSFLNWRALSYALLKNIVPDFPLCNKSFNQSYSGNDL